MPLETDGVTERQQQPDTLAQRVEALGREWVRRLRSGKYLQGKGALKYQIGHQEDLSSYRYCCLGVLGEIYNEQHPDQPQRLHTSYLEPDDDDTGVLNRLFKRLGHGQGHWGARNDSASEVTFAEIADEIETCLTETEGT